MAEKLTESLWTGFTKKAKLDLDDGPLVKALAKFDKTDEAKPEPRLAALEDVVDQVKKQVVALTKRKKELGDMSSARSRTSSTSCWTSRRRCKSRHGTPHRRPTTKRLTRRRC